MKKLICDICGQEIKKNEGVAVFYSSGGDKITHVSENDNLYDCDYRYMVEECNPHFCSKEEYLNQ